MACWCSFLLYFGQYGSRIVRDGQAIGPRGRGRPQDSTSGSVVSSWLASSVKVTVLQFLRLYVAPSSFGGIIGSGIGSRGRWVEISVAAIFPLPVWRQRFCDARLCGILAKMASGIFRDGQAKGPRGQGRPRYTTSSSVASSWLASSVTVRVLQLFTALRRTVGVRGRRKSLPCRTDSEYAECGWTFLCQVWSS